MVDFWIGHTKNVDSYTISMDIHHELSEGPYFLINKSSGFRFIAIVHLLSSALNNQIYLERLVVSQQPPSSKFDGEENLELKFVDKSVRGLL